MIRLFSTLLLFAFSLGSICGQAITSFDDIDIGQDTFWNGIDQSGGFTSGDAFFPNVYNPDFGGYWQAGWALSSSLDNVDGTYNNLYGAITGGGFESSNYAVGQQNSIIKLIEPALGIPISEIHITNTTYAHEAILNGNDFATKFGGDSGDDPDYFKLTIRKYFNGVLSTDSIDFYLADYRFEDNSQDYIVDSWVPVDLGSLGQVDSLHFQMSSTDLGGNGINTPLFFCIDQIVPFLVGTSPEPRALPISIFPNPATEFIQLESDLSQGDLFIYDAQGRLHQHFKEVGGMQKIDVQNFPSGMYFVHWVKEKANYQGRFIK